MSYPDNTSEKISASRCGVLGWEPRKRQDAVFVENADRVKVFAVRLMVFWEIGNAVRVEPAALGMCTLGCKIWHNFSSLLGSRSTSGGLLI